MVWKGHVSLQSCVLRLGLSQDGDVGVGVFPEGEDIVIPDTLNRNVWFHHVWFHRLTSQDLLAGYASAPHRRLASQEGFD
jgi:hypothetical protein